MSEPNPATKNKLVGWAVIIVIALAVWSCVSANPASTPTVTTRSATPTSYDRDAFRVGMTLLWNEKSLNDQALMCAGFRADPAGAIATIGSGFGAGFDAVEMRRLMNEWC